MKIKLTFLILFFVSTNYIFGQLDYMFDITVKNDWRVDSTILSNGNYDLIYWDTIETINQSKKEVVQIGSDVYSSKGVLLYCFRRDSLMKTYFEFHNYDNGKHNLVFINDSSYSLNLYYSELGHLQALENYEDGKKHGFSLWFNPSGVVSKREFYVRGEQVGVPLPQEK